MQIRFWHSASSPQFVKRQPGSKLSSLDLSFRKAKHARIIGRAQHLSYIPNSLEDFKNHLILQKAVTIQEWVSKIIVEVNSEAFNTFVIMQYKKDALSK